MNCFIAECIFHIPRDLHNPPSVLYSCTVKTESIVQLLQFLKYLLLLFPTMKQFYNCMSIFAALKNPGKMNEVQAPAVK